MFGWSLEFTRQSKLLAPVGGYTPEVKSRAPGSGFTKVIYDGRPSLTNPADHLRGVRYYVWFRPLGWTLTISNLHANLENGRLRHMIDRAVHKAALGVAGKKAK